MTTKITKTLSFLSLSLLSCFIFSACLENSTSSGTTLNVFEKTRSFNDLESFSSFLDSTGLDSVLAHNGPFTLFAPNDEAFSHLPDGMLDSLSKKALRELLRYHIVKESIILNRLSSEHELTTMQGGDLFLSVGTDSVRINDGQLIAGNIPATNGIIHATNKVLFPDSYLSVVQIIAKRYRLDALEKALKDTDLAAALEKETDSGFTVFAPTDSILKNAEPPQEQQLRELLEYHILPQKILLEDLGSTQSFETMSGQELTLEVSGNTVRVNGNAVITTADLEGRNGAVHVIDSLLAPPAY